ncbi:hypothetical protein GCM10009799_04710 [Nocardiopsis rhodophaea]|uniref:VOC domain-containing protein n=1 Tax=Nocardiopsis rhodophaea TaxID=280238 RepID=A0ABN2S9H9_9ACTN
MSARETGKRTAMCSTQQAQASALTAHHVGFTVPDLEEAITFFTRAFDARLLHRFEPAGSQSDEDGWMERQLGVDSKARMKIASMALGTMQVEFFEYEVPHQRRNIPANSDWGGHHFALQVPDAIEPVLERIRTIPGVTVQGEIQEVTDATHPLKGVRWIYFRAPWGMQLELFTPAD